MTQGAPAAHDAGGVAGGMAGRDTTYMLALTGLALVLRVWGINSDLWLDEITTLADFMRRAPLDAASVFPSANQHVMNSVLGSISIRLFGESEWAARLPSVLFGIATIPVFFALARRVADRREAICATLFVALSYHHVWFTQNARGYSAMIFFAVATTLMLVRWLGGGRSGRRSDGIWFCVMSAAGMLSLLNYAFVLAGQFVAGLYVLARAGALSRVWSLAMGGVLIAALTLLAYAPTLSAMVAYFTAGGEGLGWQDPLAFARLVASELVSARGLIALPVLIGGAVIAMTGWGSYLKGQPVIALMLVIPAAFNVVAVVALNFGAYPRSFLYVLPFGTLVLVRGGFVLGSWLTGVFHRAGRAVRADWWLPGIFIAGAVLMLPRNYRHPKQDYTGSLAFARANAAPGDVIASVGPMAVGYKVHYGRDLAFPATAAELRALEQPGRRVWVIYSLTREMHRNFSDIQAHIDSGYKLERTFWGTLGDGNVHVAATPRLP